MTTHADTPPSLREFAYHVYADRYRAFAIFTLVFAAFLLAAALIRPSYRATATLAVLPSPEFTVRSAAGSHDSNASALALDQIMKAESAILDSDDLHAATIGKLGPAAIYPDIFGPDQRNLAWQMLRSVARALTAPWRVAETDPVAAREERGLRQFATDFDVRPTKDANVITVSLDNRNPGIAAAGVNALLGLYAARRTRLYDDPQLQSVREAVRAAAARAAAADHAVAAYKRQNGLSDSGQQRALLLHRLDQAQSGMAEAAAARLEQQARADALAAQLRAEPVNVPIFHEQDPDTRLQAVNASLQDTLGNLAKAREKYRDGSMVVTMLKAQIGAQRAEAARLGHDPAASVVRQGRNPNLEALRLDCDRAAAELAAADARFAAERREAAATQSALDRLDAAESGLMALQREAAVADDDFTNASRILADRHLSESEDLLRLANVRVIQPAMVPQMPRPIPLLLAGVGFALGMFAAAIGVVSRFVLHPVFLTAEGLELATGLPVLAVFTKKEREREEAEVVF